jgi:hypothetical protein
MKRGVNERGHETFPAGQMMLKMVSSKAEASSEARTKLVPFFSGLLALGGGRQLKADEIDEPTGLLH